MTEPRGSMIPRDDLDHTEHSHEFVGADHGQVPFSVILVHSAPGPARRTGSPTAGRVGCD